MVVEHLEIVPIDMKDDGQGEGRHGTRSGTFVFKKLELDTVLYNIEYELKRKENIYVPDYTTKHS